MENLADQVKICSTPYVLLVLAFINSFKVPQSGKQRITPRSVIYQERRDSLASADMYGGLRLGRRVHETGRLGGGVLTLA